MSALKNDVLQFLQSQTALIVHFASVPPLSGTGRRYPESLLASASHRSRQLSCSVVRPGDTFGIYAATKNATGMIGLILSPNDDGSVIAVGPKDAGSIVQPDGTRHFTPEKVTQTAMEGSMLLRGVEDGPNAAYNEWGLGNYQVVGLFVANPTENEVQLEGAASHSTELVVDTLARFKDFELRAYTFSGGSLAEVVGKTLHSVEHVELYQ